MRGSEGINNRSGRKERISKQLKRGKGKRGREEGKGKRGRERGEGDEGKGEEGMRGKGDE